MGCCWSFESADTNDEVDSSCGVGVFPSDSCGLVGPPIYAHNASTSCWVNICHLCNCHVCFPSLYHGNISFSPTYLHHLNIIVKWSNPSCNPYIWLLELCTQCSNHKILGMEHQVCCLVKVTWHFCMGTYITNIHLSPKYKCSLILIGNSDKEGKCGIYAIITLHFQFSQCCGMVMLFHSNEGYLCGGKALSTT